MRDEYLEEEYLEEVEDLLDNDEISAQEEGFMIGESQLRGRRRGSENE